MLDRSAEVVAIEGAWTRHHVLNGAFLVAVANSPTGLVATAWTATGTDIYMSEDGSTWTFDGALTGAWPTDIVHGSAGVVIVGIDVGDKVVSGTKQGSQWVVHEIGGTGVWPYRIVAARDRYVLVGGDIESASFGTRAWASCNGADWVSSRSAEFPQDLMYDATGTAHGFWAVGFVDAYFAADGISWQRFPTSSTNFAVVEFGGGPLVVGSEARARVENAWAEKAVPDELGSHDGFPMDVHATSGVEVVAVVLNSSQLPIVWLTADTDTWWRLPDIGVGPGGLHVYDMALAGDRLVIVGETDFGSEVWSFVPKDDLDLRPHAPVAEADETGVHTCQDRLANPTAGPPSTEDPQLALDALTAWAETLAGIIGDSNNRIKEFESQSPAPGTRASLEFRLAEVEGRTDDIALLPTPPEVLMPFAVLIRALSDHNQLLRDFFDVNADLGDDDLAVAAAAAGLGEAIERVDAGCRGLQQALADEGIATDLGCSETP